MYYCYTSTAIQCKHLVVEGCCRGVELSLELSISHCVMPVVVDSIFEVLHLVVLVSSA